jgi:hypothetical protein
MTEMNPDLEQSIIRRARTLVSTRASWTRRAEARDRDGKEVDSLSAAAVRFCAEGAVLRAAHDLTGAHGPRLVGMVLGMLVRVDRAAGLPNRWWAGLSEVNDYKKRAAHRAVLRIFDDFLAGRQARGDYSEWQPPHHGDRGGAALVVRPQREGFRCHHQQPCSEEGHATRQTGTLAIAYACRSATAFNPECKLVMIVEGNNGL